MSLLGSLASCGRRGTFWPRKATTHGKRRVHQQDKRGHLNAGPNHSGKCLAGAQAKGHTATAIASSKLLPVAVKAMAVVCGYEKPDPWATAKLVKNITTK